MGAGRGPPPALHACGAHTCKQTFMYRKKFLENSLKGVMYDRRNRYLKSWLLIQTQTHWLTHWFGSLDNKWFLPKTWSVFSKWSFKIYMYVCVCVPQWMTFKLRCWVSMVYLDTVTRHYGTMATFSSKSSNSFTDPTYISCWPLLVFCSAPSSSQAILPTPLRLPSSRQRNAAFLCNSGFQSTAGLNPLLTLVVVKQYLSRWSKLTSAVKRHIEHVLLTLWE